MACASTTLKSTTSTPARSTSSRRECASWRLGGLVELKRRGPTLVAKLYVRDRTFQVALIDLGDAVSVGRLSRTNLDTNGLGAKCHPRRRGRPDSRRESRRGARTRRAVGGRAVLGGCGERTTLKRNTSQVSGSAAIRSSGPASSAADRQSDRFSRTGRRSPPPLPDVVVAHLWHIRIEIDPITKVPTTFAQVRGHLTVRLGGSWQAFNPLVVGSSPTGPTRVRSCA